MFVPFIAALASGFFSGPGFSAQPSCAEDGTDAYEDNHNGKCCSGEAPTKMPADGGHPIPWFQCLPSNLDDVCPDGSAAVELPASSPWHRQTSRPSCDEVGGKFVSYLPKMCEGDESSVVIYLNGENTNEEGCMAASVDNCLVDMSGFQRLEADVRMKECMGLWTAALWQEPVFKAKGEVNGVTYNQGLSGEYDYLETCGVGGGHTGQPETNVGYAPGGWRAPTPQPPDLDLRREQFDKHWTTDDDFAQHVTVFKDATGDLWVQYCAVGTSTCQITPESAHYGIDIRLSEIFTGTLPGKMGETNHPVPSDEKGKVRLISDIWNVAGGCSPGAMPNVTCRMSVTNLKVTGGLPEGDECSKIKATPQVSAEGN
jgi:hypothetical protein